MAMIIVICPNSTPILKDKIEVKNLLGGRPISFKTDANPNP